MRIIIVILILNIYGFAQEWINYTNYNSIYDIVNHQDVLWIATHGGLVKFHKQSEEIEYYNRANSGIPDNQVACLALDAAGNIWLGTQRYGVGKFDGENCTVYNTYNSGLSNNTIFDVFVDSVDNIWIGTYVGGLVRFDRENEWTVFNTRNSGISSNHVSVIKTDSKDNKCMGHFFSGISVFREGGVIITDTVDGHTPIPNNFTLYQNYPNPFNPSTTIKFSLPKQESVIIAIYNILGEKLETLLNKKMPAGSHEVEFNAQNISSGIYFYHIQAGEFQDVKKMILL